MPMRSPLKHARPLARSASALRRVAAVGSAAVVLTTAGAAPLASSTAHASPVGRSSTEAVAARASVLRTVVFGDSVPSGSACHCRAYPLTTGEVVARTQRRTPRTTNFARGGLTTTHVVQQLQGSQTRRAVAASDLAIVQVGANDFNARMVARCRNRIASCYGPQLRRLRTNLTSSLRTISTLQRNARSEVVVLGYWNVFQDGRVGRSLGRDYVVGSDRLTRAVNRVVAGAAADAGALYADAYRPFKGSGSVDPTRCLAADGDHPNARGHALLRAAVLRRLGSRVATV